MQATSMFSIAVCLFASVYTVLGMGNHGTVYYRDGQVCNSCNEEQVVPYKQTYTPEEVGKRVVYTSGPIYRTEERIISRPSSSNSYVVNRADTYSDQESCHTGGRWGPCGENTKCEVVNGVPTCSCLRGYVGSPLNGCRHECESDYDCGSQEFCKDFKCTQSCSQCGIGAQCARVANHRAICECPKNYFGNPNVECRAECYGDRDCPSGRPACIYGVCKNLCEGACGINADCNLRGLTPICSCPKDMTGDPFVSCRRFTPEDLCSPNNPCGTNAKCTPGHDNTGRERPVCTCLPGYTGNPLSHCVRGECQSDVECSDSRACINYSCVDPCLGQCGSNAICEARRHVATCKCPQGYIGEPLVSCRQSRSYPVARYYKKK